MFKFRWLVILVLFLMAVRPGFADERAKLPGTWKLVSFEREFQETGAKEPLLGKNPNGYIIFTPQGRFMVVITGEGRMPPKTDQDRAILLNSMYAYTGMYRVEGDKFIVKVDVAWNPEWVGTDQERTFKIEGNRLHLFTKWAVSPNWPDKGMGRGVVTFERAK